MYICNACYMQKQVSRSLIIVTSDLGCAMVWLLFYGSHDVAESDTTASARRWTLNEKRGSVHLTLIRLSQYATCCLEIQIATTISKHQTRA